MSTLSQRVLDGLKDEILAGTLPSGAKLPSEAALVESYGVSRTVVREAVQRLQAEGLVETFQGRGSYVLTVPQPSQFSLETSALRNQHDVLAMIDFRRGIESEAAALAAARLAQGGQEADRSAIRAAHEAFVAAAHVGAVEADFAFHRAIAHASGNRFFSDLLDSLGPMMIMLPRTQLAKEYTMTDATHVERVHREHDAVAAAVLAGDVDTARAAMRVHLGNTRRRLGGTTGPV